MVTYEIPLNIHPSQEFSAIIGDEMFYFRLKTAADDFSGKELLYMDLTLNGDPIFEGILCKPNINLLEIYRYLRIKGRLIFETSNDDYPQWERLGISDRLYYVV